MTKQKTILHLIGNTTTPSKYPIASEYIKPMGKINITSHGLGSGIYGLSIFKYIGFFNNFLALSINSVAMPLLLYSIFVHI